MSKRRLQREVDDLSEDLLGDLSSTQRLRLFLEGQSREKDQWIERLRDTCPRYRYESTDREFTVRAEKVILLAHICVYRFRTLNLQHELLKTKQEVTWAHNLYRDDTSIEEIQNRTAERTDYMRELFAELYVEYHVYQRFAEEILGVDMQTWIALHLDGPGVLNNVSEALDDQLSIQLAEEWLNEGLEDATEDKDDFERVTLAEIVEWEYAALTTVWNDMTDDIVL